jgi:hypothetical protein
MCGGIMEGLVGRLCARGRVADELEGHDDVVSIELSIGESEKHTPARTAGGHQRPRRGGTASVQRNGIPVRGETEDGREKKKKKQRKQRKQSARACESRPCCQRQIETVCEPTLLARTRLPAQLPLLRALPDYLNWKHTDEFVQAAAPDTGPQMFML